MSFLSSHRASRLSNHGGARWSAGLLDAGEPDPVGHRRSNSPSRILLTCDHAGRRIPRRLARLGLQDDELRRHSAVDLGALALSRHLSRLLGAELIYQRYSRLVIDCNRPPHMPQAFVTHTDRVPVPGNAALGASEAASRVAELFAPYHRAIEHSLERRRKCGERTVLVAMHSFTPEHATDPAPRPWPVSLLFNRDRRLADALRTELCRDEALDVGMNVPYAVDDDGDYAIPVHGERRGIAHVTVEVRQDLLSSAVGQHAWAERLAGCIARCAEGSDL